MKKALLLFSSIALLCFSAKADITFTATVSPVYANDATVTITAQGETTNLAVDMQTLPTISGSPTVVSPANVYNGLFGLTNITRVSYYNPVNGTKSSFTAKISSQYGADATVKWVFNCSFIDIKDVQYSNGTVPFTVTIKPGSRPLPVFYSAEYSKTFTRNNCAAGYTGGTYSLSVSYGFKTSTVSQAAANQAAIDYVNSTGQASANANAGCNIVYNSAQISGSFARSNCAIHYESGPTIPYTLPAGAATSIVSQADADAQAQVLFNINGQANANANGTCVAKQLTVITYSNQTPTNNLSHVTRVRVYNAGTSTLIGDFTEAQITAGAEIPYGTYDFVVTTSGSSWGSLELGYYTTGLVRQLKTNATNYTFSNYSTTNLSNFSVVIYFGNPE